MSMQATEKVPVRKEGNFDLNELGALPSFYLAQLNHAEDKIAFYWDKTGRLELYVIDLKTSEIEQVTNGELPRTVRAGYEWSHDDQKIIFTRDRAGNEMHDLYEINVEAGDVMQLTNTPNARDVILDAFPDGKWYLVNSDRDGQMNLYRMDVEKSENFEQITE